MLRDPGLYVHLPWCIRKCPYCDFNSHPIKPTTDLAAYTQALVSEWRHRSAAFSEKPVFASVFFGGGTPSLFNPEHFASLLDELPLAMDAEVTMEANPGTTEHAVFSDYRAAGVNRLSLGAQSFNDAHLGTLGRIHSASEVKAAYHSARDAGYNNINLDLMWGLPGQTVDQALSDLEQALDLAPDHISWYQLTLEPKTEFGARPPILPQEASLATIESEGLARLHDAGFERYEVSAYARSKRCLHNVNYWQFGDYVGLGAGAHGKETFAAPERTQNPHQPRVYLNNPSGGVRHAIAAPELPFEFMLNVLRLRRGVAFEAFVERTGIAWEAIAEVWNTLAEKDLVRPDRIATTDFGYRYLDSVVSEFLR